MFPFVYRPSVDYCRANHVGCDHEHGSCLIYDVAGIDDPPTERARMTDEEKAAWKKRLGVGERQPRDSVVTDGTRTHTRAVENQIIGGVAGTQTEHRSGRVDAKVTNPQVTHVNVPLMAGVIKKETRHGQEG